MVNTEEFTIRLHKIMEYHDLSAASFADKIEVGRSSISHLLSGRNKPSLDFVMKIVKAFPDVELYWLLNGKGSFPKRGDSDNAKSSTTTRATMPVDDLFSQAAPVSQGSLMAPTPTSEKTIDRIVIFYKDGTFEAFEHGEGRKRS